MVKVDTLKGGRILRFRMIGDYDMEELMGLIKEHYPTAQHGVLWDIREGVVGSLTADEARQLAQQTAKLARHRKTAYLGPSGITFGVLRMYTTYAELHAVAPNVMAFSEEADAMAWLVDS